MPEASGNAGQDQALTAAIPKRIKLLRTRASLTGAQLDRATRLCAGTIGRLERGDQKVYANHLYLIAQAIGVDVGWFYRKDGEAPDIGNEHELEMQCLLEAYLRITDPVLKRDVFELVETLAETTKD